MFPPCFKYEHKTAASMFSMLGTNSTGGSEMKEVIHFFITVIVLAVEFIFYSLKYNNMI